MQIEDSKCVAADDHGGDQLQFGGLDPERDAREVLETHWMGEDHLIAVPVDPILIARKLEIAVYTADLPGNVSGKLSMSAGRDPEIYLTRTDNYRRQRFTCAHMLGHWAKHVADGIESDQIVDHRGPLSSIGSAPSEHYANQFAAALLMPKEEIGRRQAKGYGPIALADFFRVSPEAARYRIENIGAG